MTPKKLEVIKCPHCDREYLPAEIFVPKAVFGTPKDVERDYSGKIINYFGTPMEAKESYICDGCNTKFEVTVKLSFYVLQNKLGNFDEEYTTKIGYNNLFMSEEST